MPKYENHPYLFVNDGKACIYVFNSDDMLSEGWKTKYKHPLQDYDWISARKANGSITKLYFSSPYGLVLEQPHEWKRYTSTRIDVSRDDLDGFWAMLKSAITDNSVEHSKILV